MKIEKFFTKGFTPNWSVENFVTRKLKNTIQQRYQGISDVNGGEIVGIFYVKKMQKINQTECRIEEVVRKKRHKIKGKVMIIHSITGLI